MSGIDFDTSFAALTGHPPFPWQQALFARFANGEIPPSASLPTGLGKTSVIAIWLIALANGVKVPRRLVYVVNRRTVVDQTTDEVEKYKKNLAAAGIKIDLALSTLRGQFADNREWSADPSRPAVICGTVDMIGSRLLFSGYGVGFKGKPLHAGFLGQDAILVHDEAHLEPAFQELLLTIEKEQTREREGKKELTWPPIRVMELTATSKTKNLFVLTDGDYRDETVNRRMNAVKTLHLKTLADPKKPQADLIKKSLEFKDSGKAVLIFAYGVDTVLDVANAIEKAKQPVKTLTGTMRGKERDDLVKDATFARFLPNPPADATPKTVYLVCTSAGEVGVNISADHLICDLSTYESMAQRLGRVNRFGNFDSCEVHVFYPDSGSWDDKHPLTEPRKKTLELFQSLDGTSVSPKSLSEIPAEKRNAAFAPTPTILPATDILFDAWALTTIKGKLPGRPPVEPYLHGITDYDPPQTTVAWREEIERLTEGVLKYNNLDIGEVLEKYPLKPHEELSGPTNGNNKVFEQLEVIAERDAKREPEYRLSAWVVEPDGSGTIYPLQALVERDSAKKPIVALGGRTVILPPKAGGFRSGLLKGDEPFSSEIEYDVSDHWYLDKEQTVKRRGRSEDSNPPEAEMREVLRIDFPASEDNEDAETKSWYWFVRPLSADDDGSKYSQRPITWQHHTDDVTAEMTRIAAALFPNDKTFRKALIVSAKLHDLGKKRFVWQRSIGNPEPKNWHAKSGKGWRPMELTSYRHEFGSLVDLENDPDFLSLPNDELKELVRHLIAVHHGFGRPHFPDPFDPNATEAITSEIAAAVPRRFAQLQRKFGRWGLAYLESLLRAADWAASAKPTKEVRV